MEEHRGYGDICTVRDGALDDSCRRDTLTAVEKIPLSPLKRRGTKVLEKCVGGREKQAVTGKKATVPTAAERWTSHGQHVKKSDRCGRHFGRQFALWADRAGIRTGSAAV